MSHLARRPFEDRVSRRNHFFLKSHQNRLRHRFSGFSQNEPTGSRVLDHHCMNFFQNSTRFPGASGPIHQYFAILCIKKLICTAPRPVRPGRRIGQFLDIPCFTECFRPFLGTGSLFRHIAYLSSSSSMTVRQQSVPPRRHQLQCRPSRHLPNSGRDDLLGAANARVLEFERD